MCGWKVINQDVMPDRCAQVSPRDYADAHWSTECAAYHFFAAHQEKGLYLHAVRRAAPAVLSWRRYPALGVRSNNPDNTSLAYAERHDIPDEEWPEPLRVKCPALRQTSLAPVFARNNYQRRDRAAYRPCPAERYPRSASRYQNA